MTKRTKASVDYSKGKPQSRCAICRHFVPPNRCTLVQGRIDGAYWCTLFAKSRRRK